MERCSVWNEARFKESGVAETNPYIVANYGLRLVIGGGDDDAGLLRDGRRGGWVVVYRGAERLEVL